MTRREFIVLLGSAIVWPGVTHAQQSAMLAVGFASHGENAPYTAGFIRGLNEAGFTEGQNVVIEYRWPEGHYDRLPTLAADLVRHKVAVIFASGG